jgi:hypothetical protein
MGDADCVGINRLLPPAARTGFWPLLASARSPPFLTWPTFGEAEEVERGAVCIPMAYAPGRRKRTQQAVQAHCYGPCGGSPNHDAFRPANDPSNDAVGAVAAKSGGGLN